MTLRSMSRTRRRRGACVWSAGFLADTGRDMAAEVIAKVILRQAGMG